MLSVYFSCVSFFLSENPQIPIQDLYRDAMAQFLLADLREIGVSSLPDTVINNSGIFNLTGKYTLQMQQLIDICEILNNYFNIVQN